MCWFGRAFAEHKKSVGAPVLVGTTRRPEENLRNRRESAALRNKRFGGAKKNVLGVLARRWGGKACPGPGRKKRKGRDRIEG